MLSVTVRGVRHGRITCANLLQLLLRRGCEEFGPRGGRLPHSGAHPACINDCHHCLPPGQADRLEAGVTVGRILGAGLRVYPGWGDPGQAPVGHAEEHGEAPRCGVRQEAEAAGGIRVALPC